MKPHSNCSIKAELGPISLSSLSLPPEGSEVSLGEQDARGGGGGWVGWEGLEGVIEAQGRQRGDRTPVCGAHHLRRQWGGHGWEGRAEGHFTLIATQGWTFK